LNTPETTPLSIPTNPATGPPQRSLAGDSPHSAKRRHFRRLAVRSLVSGEEFRASRTEGPESRGVSLVDHFSISEFRVREFPETGCVSAEAGSNLLRTLDWGTTRRPSRVGSLSSTRDVPPSAMKIRGYSRTCCCQSDWACCTGRSRPSTIARKEALHRARFEQGGA
jgi:hypothetical protein